MAATEESLRRAFRQAVANSLEQHLFYTHGNFTGSYTWGPPGCQVKRNVLALWREHFMVEERMLEVSFYGKTVWKNCGQVFMVKDKETGTCYRADHLLKEQCKDKFDGFSGEQIGAKIKQYGIVAPDTKNPLSDPYRVNLMFPTLIGSSRASTGYMHPNIDQGVFSGLIASHFYNGKMLPLGVAQAGQVTTNKISPPRSLIHALEFTVAEIEQFVDPDHKSHPKYSQVSNLVFLMFPRDKQLFGRSAERLCLGEVVSNEIVNNQTLAYLMGRVYLFLIGLGIDEKRVRFKQHLSNEMATDGWDAEIECSYGWIECGVIAYRSVQMVVEALKAMNQALGMKAAFETKGEVEFDAFTASMIEASLDIDRIIYCLYEHSFYTRRNKAGGQKVFRFTRLVAPYKCVVFPLPGNQQYKEVVTKICKSLKAAYRSYMAGIYIMENITSPIEKRYRISDELGAPFAVTVDDTESVTIRERDSKGQIRVNVSEVAQVVKALSEGLCMWADILQKYPLLPHQKKNLLTL